MVVDAAADSEHCGLHQSHHGKNWFSFLNLLAFSDNWKKGLNELLEMN